MVISSKVDMRSIVDVILLQINQIITFKVLQAINMHRKKLDKMLVCQYLH